MSQQAIVFEATKKTFDEAVLFNSHKVPVIVEFLGVWSGPCSNLEFRFSNLAKEFPEQFVFAKVDIDEQQELVKEYDITNVPTTLVFQNGKEVRREEGEMGDEETRELLKIYGIFRESDAMREQARELHMSGNTNGAIQLLTQAIQKDPANPRVVLDMVTVLMDLGQVEQAEGLFQRLPESARETELGKILQGQITFANLAAKTDGEAALTERVNGNGADDDARFDLAVCMVARREFVGAMDQLFTILDQAPEYRDGAARELIVTLINMLTTGSPDLAAEYRRRLANVLAE